MPFLDITLSLAALLRSVWRRYCDADVGRLQPAEVSARGELTQGRSKICIAATRLVKRIEERPWKKRIRNDGL